MANSAAVPRLHQPILPKSACVRLPTLPVIVHPLTKLGDRSKLKVSGSASLDLRRSKTMYPSINIATYVSWSGGEVPSPVGKNRRYRKRVMATRSKSDQELLDQMTARLIDGYDGIRHMFRTYDPVGEECVTSLGLDKKETVSFDMFVSRFKEYADIQKKWVPPLKREAEAERQQKAHPEEELRDSEVAEWAQLKVAPEADLLLRKALKEKKIDMRSILPDECYEPQGVVTKVQFRVALQEIGVNLTDDQYRRLWAKYDKTDLGFLPRDHLYGMLNLDPDGTPIDVGPKVRTPVEVVLKCPPPPPARNPAKAAREFAIGRHKVRGDPWALEDGIKGLGIQSPVNAGKVDSGDAIGPGGVEEKPESPAAEAAARSKIRAVMTSTSHTMFDDIIDCLHHKFEEQYNNMMSAFKLFDIHNDGSIMRIDFRRVLREYGFPVTALQLRPLIQQLGLNINHGLISYRQVLGKLMNRHDAFTSTVLDDYITAVKEGRSTEPQVTGADTEVEEMTHKLVQTLHQDYVKMSAELLRKDRTDGGVLPPAEIRSTVDKLLGQSMTEPQWDALQRKLPYDAQGNVRYADFMVKGFNKGEPGEWNQLTYGDLTVPRNKLVMEPSEEVKRLQKSPTDYPKAVGNKENRPVDQLRQELRQFFTDHLHDVDKRFKELDRKSHKRFSQWQFGSLLKLCGFPMTEKELKDVWLTLKLSDDNMSTFNNVVMEFAPNFTPFERHVKGQDREEEEEGQEEEKVVQQAGIGQGPVEAGGEQPEELAHSPKFDPFQYLAHIVLKAKPSVKKNWERLRQSFRNQDPHGFGTVSFQTMQRMVDSLRSGLSKEERDQLCAQFDFKSIGRCNYLAFMKMFSDPPPSEPRLVYAPYRHKLQKKPEDAPKPITVSEAMIRIRNKLIKHWKNLRRAFQKHDKGRTGELTVTDFKRVLAECSMPVTEEDLYHILTEFDSNMNGRISYHEFLDGLLRMDALAANAKDCCRD
ncbi:EF-hand calcium-binding domain-containing protein 6-like isoform X2 [Babylonia areolata]|uniref:EF-hand calcium-binding domain-containing protein 6-like isoform X2 n=1 Tax=Babylonia areolata TaxID=304850 RepID=UPI003FD526D7